MGTDGSNKREWEKKGERAGKQMKKWTSIKSRVKNARESEEETKKMRREA